MNAELRTASLRLCRQIRTLLDSEAFPKDRHARRRVLNAAQAKASLVLQQKHDAILSAIESHFSTQLPQELYSEAAKPTLDNLERHLLMNPLNPSPIELLNTFNLVSRIAIFLFEGTDAK